MGGFLELANVTITVIIKWARSRDSSNNVTMMVTLLLESLLLAHFEPQVVMTV